MEPVNSPNTANPNQPVPVAPMGDVSGKPSLLRQWKKPLIIGGVVVVLLGGTAGAYFGYYKNPNVLWSQALGNTQKGYDRLVDYGDKQAKKDYKGGKLDGTFKLTSKDVVADGNLSGVSDGTNAQGTFDIGAKGVRMKAELRTVKAANSTNPDIYVKVTGLKGLDSLLGASSGGSFDSLDNQWVVIDHTLLDQASGADKQAKELTADDITDAARRLSEVNKQYLFSTDDSKAVLTNVKKIATETRHGRETYHYQATVNKDHAVAYVDAASKALEASKLGAWVKETTGKTITQAVNIEEMRKNIKEEQVKPLDVWVDTQTRTIQNVRLHDSSDPDGYLDVGMLYTGGNKYPFTLGFYGKEGKVTSTFSMTATLDTDKQDVTLEATFGQKGGDDPVSLTFKATAKPSNDKVDVKAPANAKSLIEALGGTNLFGGMSGSTAPTTPSAGLGNASGMSQAELETLLQSQ